MELLAFTTIMLVSVGLGLAGAKLVLSVLFFFITRNVGLRGSLRFPASVELTYEHHLRFATPDA